MLTRAAKIISMVVIKPNEVAKNGEEMLVGKSFKYLFFTKDF